MFLYVFAIQLVAVKPLAQDHSMARCKFCRRELNQPEFADTLDCGGDCLRCMAEIVEDPDCVEAIRALDNEEPDAVRAQGGCA